MFITKVRLRNVKCFSDVTIEFPPPVEEGRTGGWYVLVGPNGMGKSTVLEAMALPLVGGEWVYSLLRNPGVIRWAGGRPWKVQVEARLEEGTEARMAICAKPPGLEEDTPAAWRTEASPHPLDLHFAAGYGAFRRVGGHRNPWPERFPASRFSTLFEDDYPLDATQWLVDAESRSMDRPAPRPSKARQMPASAKVTAVHIRRPGTYAELCRSVVEWVNASGVLPVGFTMLPPSPDGVQFRDPLGSTVGLAELGDGYRSIVGLLLCLLRDLFRWQPGDQETSASGSLGTDRTDAQEIARTPGVVLIDEPDAHLHPEWQRRVGFALQDVFPNIQFIVATHSPFICQAASPGGIRELRLNREENRIEVVEPTRSVRGWHIQDVYQRALGVDSWLDLDTEALLHEHAELVAADQTRELDTEERRRLIELDAHLSASVVAPGRSPEERETLDRIRRLTRQLEVKVGGGGSAG